MPWLRCSPKTEIEPVQFLAMPAIALSTVVLPEPLSPTSAKLSPSATVKPMPWVTFESP
jgi:hypothetical protein